MPYCQENCQQAQYFIIFPMPSMNSGDFLFLPIIMAAELETYSGEHFQVKGEKEHCSKPFAISNYSSCESPITFKPFYEAPVHGTH